VGVNREIGKDVQRVEEDIHERTSVSSTGFR